MATSEDHAKELLDKPKQDAVASTYDAEKNAALVKRFFALFSHAMIL